MQFSPERPPDADISKGASTRLSKLAWLAAGIASVVLLFLIENLWVDARLRHRSHRIPSFIPGAQSAAWFIVFVIGAIAIVLLIVCLVLLLKDRNSPSWIKSVTAVMVALVMLLGVEWTRVTNGQPGLRHLLFPKKRHKVVLTWQASPSPYVVAYNVYRKGSADLGYLRLNPAPVKGLTYTDENAIGGETYLYVARSVDAHGDESIDSNVFSVSIP